MQTRPEQAVLKDPSLVMLLLKTWMDEHDLPAIEWLLLQAQLKPELAYLRSCAIFASIHNNHLNMLKWLLEVKRCSFYVGDEQACEELLKKACAFKAEIFLRIFPHLFESLLYSAYFTQALQVAELQYRNASVAVRKRLDAAYVNYIELNYPNEGSRECLESYAGLNRLGAIQCRLGILLRKEDFTEASKLCWRISHNKSTVEEKEYAAIKFAEIMLIHNQAIAETGSPLEDKHDLFLLADQACMKRSLQAMFLLKDFQTSKAQCLKKQLHKILSGNSVLEQDGEHSETTWMEEAYSYYLAYFVFKNTPGGAHLNNILERLKSKGSMSELNLFTPASQEAGIAVDKKRFSL